MKVGHSKSGLGISSFAAKLGWHRAVILEMKEVKPGAHNNTAGTVWLCFIPDF